MDEENTYSPAYDEVSPEEGQNVSYEADEDINLEEEYKPLPLIPQGYYHGAVTGVEWDPGPATITWNITLNGNDGLKSDGETPIDGSTLTYTNWLPLPGDENKMTKKQTMTIRQAKINMLHDFVKDMKLDITTVGELLKNVSYGEYVGRDVTVKISIRKYEGRTFNSVERMVAE